MQASPQVQNSPLGPTVDRFIPDPFVYGGVDLKLEQMTVSRSFFRFAAICALITACTTVIVHAVPSLFDSFDTFEKRLELRNNWIYMNRFWIVLLHCALVLISMFAVGIRKLQKSPVAVTLGFLCFVIFAFTEWLRTTLAIFALNRSWRHGYVESTSDSMEAI